MALIQTAVSYKNDLEHERKNFPNFKLKVKIFREKNRKRHIPDSSQNFYTTDTKIGTVGRSLTSTFREQLFRKK